MISSHKLHHAVAIAEQRSFRKAAEVLNLTQPALSRSIQSLERSLGVTLFDRGRRGVEPTAIGQVVVDRARELLSGVRELEREVELFRGLGAGTLAVSLAPYPSALSGQRAVARLLAEHPEIQCRLRVASISGVTEDVALGRSEIGIADLEAAMERDLVTETLAGTPIYFFARPQHPLVGRRRCTLDDVLQFSWAAIRAPARIAAHLPADVGRAGRWDRVSGEFVSALEVDVVSEFMVLARESDILVAATLTMVENDLVAGELAVVLFSAPWLRLGYGLISRPNRTLSPAALEFMEIVREIEADLDEREAALRARYLR